ncbi:hypothetical protein SVIO_110360 [Streptomyces violaceusniger]|uniref:Uncharacterized protein n=1 Tax=Streptomyces violaceusniger TaxID=68280 RepID=A0A4D4LQP9_STRVO|nr:hypothetical protein SVIO_110360 [Streptomyces violaceusniger]
MVSLPDPFIPATNQVGSIVHASAGINASARGSSLSGTSRAMPRVPQSAAKDPEAKGQRPLTR